MKINIQPKQKERGQSMIELALVIAILMVLLAGTIDLGRAFFTWLALRDAAQEGATYGAIDPSASKALIEARVRQTFSDVVTDSEASILVNINISGDPGFPDNRCLGYHPDPNSNNALKPNKIQVVINYQNFPLAMPFLGTVLGSQTIHISATIVDSIIAPVCP